MKLPVLTIGFALLAGAALAGEGYLRSLPKDEFKAAGLDKLTEAELEKLEAIFAARQRGEVTAVREEAAAKVAAAEEKARKAEAKQPAEAAGEKKPGWLKALVTLERSGKAPEKEEAFEARLKGRFTGWRGRTMFMLENGQRWQQANPGEYSPVNEEESPRVKIYPGSLGSYWLEVAGHRQRVRVKPVSLQ